MKNIKILMQQRKIKEALIKFRALSETEQEDFFREMIPSLFPPSLISVLFRKLKPGNTFEDFHEAWRPPLKEGQDQAHYIQYPNYVVSAQNKDDISDILTLGLLWMNEEQLEQELKHYAKTEAIRHDKIATVADKIGKTLFYKVKDVTKLGS